MEFILLESGDGRRAALYPAYFAQSGITIPQVGNFMCERKRLRRQQDAEQQ